MIKGKIIDVSNVGNGRKSTCCLCMACMLLLLFCWRNSASANEQWQSENGKILPKLDLALDSFDQPLKKYEVIPYRSPGLAMALSIGSTVTLMGVGACVAIYSDEYNGIGTGMLLAGAIFGPSIGHMYTGEWGRVAAFSGGRLGTLLLGAGGLTAGFSSANCWENCGNQGSTDALTADVLVGAALIGWASLSLWELFDTFLSAERYNEAKEIQFRVAPFVSPSLPGNGGQGALAAGLVFSGTM